MATAAGSEGDLVDLGAGLAEASVGVASLVVLGGAVALVEAVAAEVGLLGGSFRGSRDWDPGTHTPNSRLTINQVSKV